MYQLIKFTNATKLACLANQVGKGHLSEVVKVPRTYNEFKKSNKCVMFCGNANGDSMPPYVIYKGEHLWTKWTENGPEGARYNRTKQD